MPFSTALLGECILTGHAAPAVILYEVTMAFQAIGRVLITQAALKDHLGKSEKANLQIRKNGQYAFFAFWLYIFCGIIAIWFPLTIAIVTPLSGSFG